MYKFIELVLEIRIKIKLNMIFTILIDIYKMILNTKMMKIL